MNLYLYAAFCVLVPLVWGLVVVQVSNRIDAAARRRRASGKHNDSTPPTEYYI